MFYLMMYSTHIIYSYMALDICKETLRQQERKPAAVTS